MAAVRLKRESMSCAHIVPGTQWTLNKQQPLLRCVHQCVYACVHAYLFLCVNCAHMYGCESVCDKGELVYLSLRDFDEWQ